MHYKNIQEIQRELENVVIAFFRQKESSYWHLHAWDRYRIVEETVSHLFEQRKNAFNELKCCANNISDDTIELEQKLFISWVALAAYHELNAIGSLYDNEVIQYKNN